MTSVYGMSCCFLVWVCSQNSLRMYGHKSVCFLIQQGAGCVCLRFSMHASSPSSSTSSVPSPFACAGEVRRRKKQRVFSLHRLSTVHSNIHTCIHITRITTQWLPSPRKQAWYEHMLHAVEIEMAEMTPDETSFQTDSSPIKAVGKRTKRRRHKGNEEKRADALERLKVRHRFEDITNKQDR